LRNLTSKAYRKRHIRCRPSATVSGGASDKNLPFLRTDARRAS
jgi:hypothetical protein